jgi:hypothetical protein
MYLFLIFFISEKHTQENKLNRIQFVRLSCTAGPSFKLLPLDGSELLMAENVTPINSRQMTVIYGQECVDIYTVWHRAAHVHDGKLEQIFLNLSDNRVEGHKPQLTRLTRIMLMN